MALSVYTAPASEPVSLTEAKAQCRIDTTDEDDLVTTLIVAAREFVESYTHRALVTQVWDYQLDAFPDLTASGFLDQVQGAIYVPKPPLRSVTSITYIDMAGTTQTWDSTLYSVDAPAGNWARMGRIVPAYQQIYPVTRWIPNAVTVRFSAGYGAATAVPSGIKAAMKLLIGNWWLNREAGQIVRGSADVLPFGVEALLWPFKAF